MVNLLKVSNEIISEIEAAIQWLDIESSSAVEKYLIFYDSLLSVRSRLGEVFSVWYGTGYQDWFNHTLGVVKNDLCPYTTINSARANAIIHKLKAETALNYHEVASASATGLKRKNQRWIQA